MRQTLFLLTLAMVLTGCAGALREPQTRPSAEQMAEVRQLAESPAIERAFQWVDVNREQILQEWRTITEIPAPSGKEQRRAAYVEELLRDYALEVSQDAAGNVIAIRRGTGEGPTTVFDAHLDTVFGEEVDVTTTVRDGRLYAPGVGDDTRNVVAMLATIQALEAADVKTKGDLVFAFTVREETDFAGVKQLLADHQQDIDHFVALDGGFRSITYGGTGTYWYRYHFLGPGGHTKSSAPPWSASLPLSRAIARIYEIERPEDLTYLNIGMLGGSDVINAKARDAWFSLDIRATDAAALQALDTRILEIVQEEARRAGMQMRQEVISRESVAQLEGNRTSPLLLKTMAIYQHMGAGEISLSDSASNHSSEALRRGIPAISTGAAPCRGAHSLDEWCAIEPIYQGIKRLILMSAALTE